MCVCGGGGSKETQCGNQKSAVFEMKTDETQKKALMSSTGTRVVSLSKAI